MTPSFVIDCFPESARSYQRGYAIVVVDVIRATTTIATAAALGRRCFPVASREAAWRISADLPNPLLAGELSGVVPAGFEINNSPAEMSQRTDVSRPLVLLSSSGTKLIELARPNDAVYIACLRNFDPVAQYVSEQHSRVAIIGAGSRGDFREEDQMCCAWIARQLTERGFATADSETLALMKKWPIGSLDGITTGASADYLIRSGQSRDLEFVLTHVADLDTVYMLNGSEVIEAGARDEDLVGVQETSLHLRSSLPSL